MYRKVNERVVVSEDQGFEMRLDIGHCVIEYQEAERLLQIEIERVSDPLGILVYSESIDGGEPPSDTTIDAADKARILNNVRASLGVLDCPYRVV